MQPNPALLAHGVGGEGSDSADAATFLQAIVIRPVGIEDPTVARLQISSAMRPGNGDGSKFPTRWHRSCPTPGESSRWPTLSAPGKPRHCTLYLYTCCRAVMKMVVPRRYRSLTACPRAPQPRQDAPFAPAFTMEQRSWNRSQQQRPRLAAMRHRSASDCSWKEREAFRSLRFFNNGDTL
jgi:hypothetical protein